MGGLERPPPQYFPVRQGVEVGSAQAGGVLDVGEHRSGLPGLWTVTDIGTIFQIP